MEEWRALLATKLRAPAASLSSLATEHGLLARSAQKRWKRLEEARAAGATDEDAMQAATGDGRGGSNRAFTPSQTALLREQVLALPAATHEAVRTAALQLKQGLELANNAHRQQHRSDPPPFVASPSFITRFKRAHRISSHRTKLQHVSAGKKRGAAGEERDTDREAFDFVTEVNDALLRYGPSLVFNMDETPARLQEVPPTALRPTGEKEAAKIETHTNERLQITTFPCISAAGDKLPISAILRGKTDRCLDKIKKDASAAVGKVRLYYSESGWINEGIMQRWINDVLLPATLSRPAALILDDYAAHWTQPVQAAAAAANLQLIRVPNFAGATALLQPLDVQFNGPMKRRRTQLWTAKKQLDPDAKDSEQAAIERVQLAYEGMTKEATIDAFRKAQIQV